MSTSSTIAAPPKIDRLRDGETRIVLENIDWATYEALGDRLDGQHVRMTYDRGKLELMTRSSRHEFYKELSGRFISDLAFECDEVSDFRPFGETTWRRAAVARGLEADQCYYFDPAKLAVFEGRYPDRPDDPLPDLAVEIEISNSAIDKMGAYAALGFPEVWRCNGESASFEQIGPDGGYHPVEKSRFLPVTPEDWLQWLWDGETANMNDWRRRLSVWIRDELRHRPQ